MKQKEGNIYRDIIHEYTSESYYNKRVRPSIAQLAERWTVEENMKHNRIRDVYQNCSEELFRKIKTKKGYAVRRLSPLSGHSTPGYPHETPVEVQLPTISRKEPSSSITDSLENLRNLQVKEIFKLLDQVIVIATSNSSKYQKMKAILKIADEYLGI
ncbi:hypothetical protein NPIL_341721 [Nephila pilipes]|uniref:Uncharacterized protein n=1 Tax=Nephila pilipes TaxID=299642 RepID=A0A8X6QG85_NEPPI|nr:hypothetical protein NPIL_341721 [Nephila pilipes]